MHGWHGSTCLVPRCIVTDTRHILVLATSFVCFGHSSAIVDDFGQHSLIDSISVDVLSVT